MDPSVNCNDLFAGSLFQVFIATINDHMRFKMPPTGFYTLVSLTSWSLRFG